MIEILLLNYLKKTLGIDVYIEQPLNKPIEYVVLDKLGSTKNNQIKGASFAFQSYSESLFKAAVLNEKVKATIENLVSLNEISSVKLDSDYPYHDLVTKQYRYQAVYEIKYY